MEITTEKHNKNGNNGNKILEQQKQILCQNWRKNRTITSDCVMQAFLEVKREIFIEPSYHELSYADHPLPIGSGQTISQPTTVMLMLQLLDVLPEQRVLEIGTGSGYNAALLAKLTRKVVTIERHVGLAEQARDNLHCAGLEEVKVIEGDGKLGYAKLAPFDRIIITAAANQVPQNLKDQLADGGLLVAPIGATLGCEMLKLEKISQKNFKTSSHGKFSFVPLI